MTVRYLQCLLTAVLALAAATLIAAPVNAQQTISAAPPNAEEAPVAMLVDVTSGQVLHSRNADRRFVPASMTKAMTLLLAFELMAQGELEPGQIMTLRDETWEEWSGKGSTMFLPQNARVPVSDLLMAIGNISANDGSIMLAEGYAGSVEAWVALMNGKAREIGMTNSYFGTPNGWPDEGRTFTTARDLVKLGEALTERHPERYAQFVGKPGYAFNGIAQSNYDPLIGRFAGADGIKTGFTNEAGFGYLGTAKRNGRRLMLVLAGVKRNALRARLARNYMRWGFEAFEQKQSFDADQMVGYVRVQGGEKRKLAVRTQGPVIVNFPVGQIDASSARIVYDGPLRAPIAKGDEVAILEVKVADMAPARIPLLASENVERAGFFTHIFNGFLGWFE